MNRCLLGILALLLTVAIIEPVSARTWVSRKGKTLDAELIRVEGDNAVLKRDKDGREVEIEIDRFGTNDRAYLEKIRDGEAPHPKTASTKKAKTPPSQEKLIVLGVILALLNIPIYMLLGKFFFTDLHGFLDALRLCLQPDWISWFRGEGIDDMVAEFKVGIYFIFCIGAVVGEYIAISVYVLGWI